MFLTFNHAEDLIGAFVEGGHSWRYVEYPTARPWFHVTLNEFSEKCHRPTVFHIYDVADLIELAGTAKSHIQIERVLLVSHGYLNGTGEWQMDELKEVAAVSHGDNVSLAYLLRDKRTLFENAGMRDLSGSSSRVIFASPRPSKT